MNKIRTVFYPEEGVRTYVQRLVSNGEFKSESDALCFLVALGMQKHHAMKLSGDLPSVSGGKSAT